jgi:hypothetical protein
MGGIWWHFGVNFHEGFNASSFIAHISFLFSPRGGGANVVALCAHNQLDWHTSLSLMLPHPFWIQINVMGPPCHNTKTHAINFLDINMFNSNLGHIVVTQTSSTLEGSKSNINQPYRTKGPHKGHTHTHTHTSMPTHMTILHTNQEPLWPLKPKVLDKHSKTLPWEIEVQFHNCWALKLSVEWKSGPRGGTATCVWIGSSLHHS